MTGKSADRVAAQASFSALFVAIGLGSMSALGRPGTGLVLVHTAAFVLWAYWCVRAPSLWVAALLAMGFGVADSAVTFAGSMSWGAMVPVVGGVLATFTRYLPLGLWFWFCHKRVEPVWRVFGTICLSAMLAQVSEWVGFPIKAIVPFIEDLSFFAWGSRLIGGDLVSGLLDATVLETAVALAGLRQRSAGRLRSVVEAVGPCALAWIGLSTLALISAPKEQGRVVVGIPQVNSHRSYNLWRLLDDDLSRRFDESFERLLLQLKDVDLLVTTEAYDARYGLVLSPVIERWSDRSEQLLQAAVVTSYLVGPEGEKQNAAGVFDNRGEYLGVQEKIDLAPFGETPLRPGASRETFRALPGVQLGIEICLESYLRQPSLELVRKGANLLVTTTSDATFGSSILVFEHLGMSRLRAIETGRAMVWASNAGPSGVIDRFGGFRGGPFREAVAVRGVAPIYGGLTPFARFFVFWLVLPWVGGATTMLALYKARPAPQESLMRQEVPYPVALRLGGLLLLALVFVAVPSRIDQAQGRAIRGWAGVAEFWRAHAAPALDEPFQDYATSADRSADAAVKYFLRYYGLPLDGTPRLPPDATADEVRDFLSDLGVKTRVLDPLAGSLRVAGLAQLKDGHWAVVDAMEPDVYRLVAPHEGRSGEVTAKQLSALVQPRVLIPSSGD